jgi:hypothetical protein
LTSLEEYIRFPGYHLPVVLLEGQTMPKKLRKAAKRRRKLSGKSLGAVKPLKTPAAPSPVPIPYPNL